MEFSEVAAFGKAIRERANKVSSALPSSHLRPYLAWIASPGPGTSPFALED